eukprot:15431967-Alexandrium_andersonii.AAC.1
MCAHVALPSFPLGVAACQHSAHGTPAFLRAAILALMGASGGHQRIQQAAVRQGRRAHHEATRLHVCASQCELLGVHP